MLNTTVSKLVWKADGSKTVVAVEFRQSNNATVVYQAKVRKEVILAAGAINTPALLQRSGVGAASHLSSLGVSTVIDLPTVGKNLQEQTIINAIWNATKSDVGVGGISVPFAFPNLSQLFGNNATAVAAGIRSNLATWAESQKEHALSKDALKTIYQSQADIITKNKGQ